MTMMSDAPLSYTIKVIDPQGFDEMFTIREDNPADFFGKITALKKWLIDHGYTPTGQPRRPNGNGHAAPQAVTNGNQAAPTCQYHGPMKRSAKFNGWYCPSKMGDGSYCKETIKE